MKIALTALASLVLLAGSPTASPAQDRPLRITAVDVEGGAAVLFATPDGRSMLVDTGWAAGVEGSGTGLTSAQRIAAAAKKMGLTRIDDVIITHYHADHVGGLPELLKLIPVGRVVDHGPNNEPLPPATDPAKAPDHPAVLYPTYLKALGAVPRKSVGPGDEIALGALTVRFVTGAGKVIDHPAPGATGGLVSCAGMADMAQDGGIENAQSLGFVATYGKARIVDLGDLTWNMERQLVCSGDRVGPADLLIVSHHGSSLSSSPALLSVLKPRVAIVENGPKKGGDKVVLERLQTTPAAAAVWQLHGAARSPEADRPASFIANPVADGDQAFGISAEVSTDGAISVRNERTGNRVSYPAPRS